MFSNDCNVAVTCSLTCTAGVAVQFLLLFFFSLSIDEGFWQCYSHDQGTNNVKLSQM